MVLAELATLIVITALGGVFWSLLGFVRNSMKDGEQIDWSKVGKNVFIGALVGVVAGIYTISVGQSFDFESLQSIGVWFFVGFSGSVIVDKLFTGLSQRSSVTA